jgi:hypothetical protein
MPGHAAQTCTLLLARTVLPSHAVRRSSEWGVQPAYWYFTSALPKALLAAFPLAAAGALWERRVRPSVVIGLTYVCIYSILPHKEVSMLGMAIGLASLDAAVLPVACSDEALGRLSLMQMPSQQAFSRG